MSRGVLGARSVAAAVALAALVAVAACTSGPRDPAAEAPGDTPPTPGAQTGAVDSLVLERSPCFGFCPVYRLRVAGSGAVHFRGQRRGGGDTTVTDSVAPSVVARMLAGADAAFDRLPERTMGDSVFCSRMATDHPSVAVAVFRPGGVRRVDHYTGCGVGESGGRQAALDRFEAWAARIDSLAGTERWTRALGRP
jgi:hypothetical protein